MIISAVKTNVGHTESAAGLAGMLRIVGSSIVVGKNLHFERLNSFIGPMPFEKMRAVLPLENLNVPSGSPCGISSFGFSGTNAHAIVVPTLSLSPKEPTKDEDFSGFVVSARSERSLRRMLSNCACYAVTRGASLVQAMRESRHAFANHNSAVSSLRQLKILARDASREIATCEYAFDRPEEENSRPWNRTGPFTFCALVESHVRFWYAVDDHIVFGLPVLPGAAHVAAVLDQLRELDMESLSIERISFVSPFVFDHQPGNEDGLAYSYEQKDGWRVSVRSVASSRLVASGLLRTCTDVVCDDKGDMALDGKCLVPLQVAEAWKIQNGVVFGPSFCWLKFVFCDKDGSKLTGDLVRPLALAPSLFRVPVEVVDGLFQASLFVSCVSSRVLPLEVESVRVSGAALEVERDSMRVVAWRSSQENNAAHVCLVSSRGYRLALCVTLSKRSENVFDNALFDVVWEPITVIDSGAPLEGCVVVCGENQCVASKLVGSLGRVVSKFSVSDEESNIVNITALWSLTPRSLYDMFHFWKTVAAAATDSKSIRDRWIWNVIQRSQRVLSQETLLSPWSRAIWSLGRVASLEVGCGVSLIDVGCDADVLSIPWSDCKSDSLAVRNRNMFFHPVHKPFAIGDGKEEALGRCVLITGAFGALGRALSVSLSVLKCLVLLGRSTLSPIAAARDSLQSCVNVSVSEQLYAAILQAGRESGFRLDSSAFCFHLAGVVKDELLSSASWTLVKDTFRAKAGPMRWLSQNWTGRICCFSSIVSIVGNVGQSSYAAANGYLDGLALSKGREGMIISLNWGRWNGGMALKVRTSWKNVVCVCLCFEKKKMDQ